MLKPFHRPACVVFVFQRDISAVSVCNTVTTVGRSNFAYLYNTHMTLGKYIAEVVYKRL